MLIAIIFLTLLTRIPYGITTIRSCVPNTHFLLNDRLCYCNSIGQSNDATCQIIERGLPCRPGQIIWEECRQCICQDNGQILCTNTDCFNKRIEHQPFQRNGSEIWCTPFQSYYLNCTLCVCPTSGKMSEGRCDTDSSCALKDPKVSLDTIIQNFCIPKVMYLFACFHCLCSDNGIFLKDKSTEICHKTPTSIKQCKLRSLYRKDCNICLCSETTLLGGDICSQSTCKNTKLTSLSVLRSKISVCVPHKFTEPKCIYCACNSEGFVNDQVCLEQACIKIDELNYDTVKSTCIPGEMVPICMECFCPRSKLTSEKYCTRGCSYSNKLAILENVLKEKSYLIDQNILKETTGTGVCEPRSLFLEKERYCLCSDNGSMISTQCTTVLEDSTLRKSLKAFIVNNMPESIKINYNVSCEPHTFVKFDCNSCYCSKNGTIDQKWCTTDNCEAKKKYNENAISKIPKEITTCVPGAISKVNCNFCVCSSSGLLADTICTKDSCSYYYNETENDFNCEPTSYYSVDCNTCLCPSDGIKNIDKCTKNQCDSKFLHSATCSPGELFSDNCNICICPPNGLKENKICTNRTCARIDLSWNKIFNISDRLFGNYATDIPRAETCLPGEQFEVGCELCVCLDEGLRAYAKCIPMLCNNQTTTLPIHEEDEEESTNRFKEDRRSNQLSNVNLAERRAFDSITENCMEYNLTDSKERSECTPGSEYIIRCRICICPYMGSINNFCRPMPPGRYCEQAYPGYNFIPMGRRNEANANMSNTATVITKRQYPIKIHTPHNHTKYSCEKLGRLQDDCYICDCKDNVIIQEHCFKSDSENCNHVSLPSFIKTENKLHQVYTQCFI